MGMNSGKKKTLEILGKVAEMQADKKSSNWPPLCVGIIYQPKRPKRK